MSVVGAGVAAFIVLGGYSIIFFRDKSKKIEAQTDYEKEFVRLNYRFLKQYEENITHNCYLPLAFHQQLMNNLSTLCQHYKLYKKRKLSPKYYIRKLSKEDYQPVVELRYLAFRRIEPTDILVFIEIIRCDQKYAIIAAESNRSGYLLKMSKYKYRNTKELIFHIQSKFIYNDDASRAVGSSTHNTAVDYPGISQLDSSTRSTAGDHPEISELDSESGTDEFFSVSSGPSTGDSPDIMREPNMHNY